MKVDQIRPELGQRFAEAVPDAVGRIATAPPSPESETKMAKKKSKIFPQEKRIAAREIFTTRLSEAQHNELQRLAALPDAQIDYSDCPETFPEASAIQRGRFYRLIDA